MSWQPLLHGAVQERAQHTVQAVLDDLSALERDSDGDATLAGGLAGRAILYGYLAQTERGAEHASIAVRCLERAIRAMSDKPMEASLYSGLTGVGWALAH